MPRFLWFFGLALLIIGLAIVLNSFVTVGSPQHVGGSFLYYTKEYNWTRTENQLFYLGKGDELTVIVDPNNPSIFHYAKLEKAGSDWFADSIIVGQGAWAIRVPARGVYLLTVQGTVPQTTVDTLPEDAELQSSVSENIKTTYRNDLLEPALYGLMIPGLALMVASIYFGGKESR